MSPLFAPPVATSTMTEELWNTTNDPFVLLDHKFPLTGLDSALGQTRKSKLYLVACAEQVAESLPWVCRKLAQIAEQLADDPGLNRDFRQGVRNLAEDMYNTADPKRGLAEARRRLALFGIRDPQQVG